MSIIRFRCVVVAACFVLLTILNPSHAAGYDDKDYKRAFDAMMAKPADAELSFEFVQAAVRVGDVRGAVAALERILQINPALPNIELELGLLYLKVGSRDLAAFYLERSLSSPDMPPWVRNRARRLMAQAEGADSPHLFSGTVYVGGRYDTNANAGPSSNLVRAGGRDAILNDEFTEQDDFSLELIGDFQYAYAFDGEKGHQLEVDLLTYNRAYNEQSTVDTNALGLDIGPRFFDGDILSREFSIKPFVSADYVRLDGDHYLSGYGAGINLRKFYALDLLGQLTAEAAHQDFKNTSSRPRSEDKTGPFYTLDGRLTYILSPRSSLAAFVNLSRRSADVDYESYNDGRIGATLTRAHAAPFGWTVGGNWSTSLTGSVRFTRYDEPDPIVDPTRERDDTRYDAILSTNIPLGRDLTAIGSLTYTHNASSLPNYRYDNFGIALGAAWTF